MVKACIKLLITGIILLIVGIIGAAVLAVNGYEDVFSLDVPSGFRRSSDTITAVADSGRYSEEDGEFSILDMKYADTVTKLDINVTAGNFFILPEDSLSISGSNIKTEYLDYKIENGVLYVTYSPKIDLLNLDFDFDDTQIIIFVPTKVYETANFSVKAGELHVAEFKVNRLYVDLAAGYSTFSSVSVSEAAQIKMTAGDCMFENCCLYNADINMTAGSMYYNACKIIGQNAINMTAGDIYMQLIGNSSDYNISVDRTAGSVYIDEDKINSKEYAETTFATTFIIDEDSYGEYSVPPAEEAPPAEKANDLHIKITAGECNITFYENEY